MKNILNWTYINTKISKNSNLHFDKIIITAGLTSEVAALFSPTRITHKLNKDTFFLSNNAVL